MATRLLIQLGDTSAESLPTAIKQLLDNAGAKNIRASHAEMPGLYTANIPAAVDIRDLIKQLKRSPGVRYAEADTMRGTL